MVQSEPALVSAPTGVVRVTATILTPSTLVIIQAAGGISLRRDVGHGPPLLRRERERHSVWLSGIRWIEIFTTRMFRIQGTTGVIFGVAIAIKQGAIPS